MAEANVAPAPAPAEPTAAASAPSEATPNTTLTEAPQAPATPAVPTPDIPAEQVEAFNRFVNANGGFTKAFSKMKTDIGNGNINRGPTLAEGQVVSDTPQFQVAQPVPQIEKGFVSPMEMAIRQYGQAISNEYSDLGEYVSKAQYMNEMVDMGIKTVDQYGNINDNAIRKFLDLKKQAVAPKAPIAPITVTPTVEYYNVPSGAAMTQHDALAIMQQNASLRAQGQAEHPQTKQAKEFLQQHFATKKK